MSVYPTKSTTGCCLAHNAMACCCALTARVVDLEQILGGGGGGGEPGLTDGDKGDIVVSGGGAVMTIDIGAVTFPKIASLTAGNIMGRATLGVGPPEEITLSPADFLISGSTLSLKPVLFAKLPSIQSGKILGRHSAGPGPIEECDLSPSQLSLSGGVLQIIDIAGPLVTGDITHAGLICATTATGPQFKAVLPDNWGLGQISATIQVDDFGGVSFDIQGGYFPEFKFLKPISFPRLAGDLTVEGHMVIGSTANALPAYSLMVSNNVQGGTGINVTSQTYMGAPGLGNTGVWGLADSNGQRNKGCVFTARGGTVTNVGGYFTGDGIGATGISVSANGTNSTGGFFAATGTNAIALKTTTGKVQFDGLVGIGTATPLVKLDILKNTTNLTLESDWAMRISDGADTALMLGTNATTHKAYIQAMDPGGAWDARPLVLQPSGGEVHIAPSGAFVGIGIDAPEAPVHLFGKIIVDGSDGRFEVDVLDIGARLSSGAGAWLIRPTGGVGIPGGEFNLLSGFNSTGDLVLGGDAPHAQSVLELRSTTKGLLLPRMTKAQRNAIATPPDGLEIYQTDATPGLRVRESGAWVRYTATADA